MTGIGFTYQSFKDTQQNGLAVCAITNQIKAFLITVIVGKAISKHLLQQLCSIACAAGNIFNELFPLGTFSGRIKRIIHLDR